jgi:hypothetical protein
MKTLTEKSNLTPFDRMMITEAYQRCYGLQIAVKYDMAEVALDLAHETGMEVKFLLDNWEEVKTL